MAVRHTTDCRCRRNNSRDVVTKELAQTISLSQQSLFVRLCISDLVDEKSNTTLGDDIRCAVANLDADNCLGSIDAKHWEQVHNWVCAPTDHRHICAVWILPLMFGSASLFVAAERPTR